MLLIRVTRLHNPTGASKQVAFNNVKDEIVATTEGDYVLFGDVPGDVKCKRKDANTICEYTVEPTP